MLSFRIFNILPFMQIIKKLFLSVLLVSTLFSSCGGTFIPVTGTYVNQLNFLDYMMKSTLTQYDIPGGSIAVVKNGKLVYARGFGYADRDNHVPVQPSDVFRIASVTKTITGMAATKLIQDGTLNLDDTVFGPNGILNDAIYLQINDQRVYDIKVKHLLSHTSGWYGETGDDPQYDFVDIAVALGVAPPASNVNVIEYVLSQGELQFAPGTQYLYSNVGYNMLGRIIEKVSGMTYEEYVRSILADPLIGVSDMYIAGNFAADRRSNEVYYY
ncbi:MAG: serine hydrolase domain-containing protein, partial [Pseudomonadota bacterium]